MSEKALNTHGADELTAFVELTPGVIVEEEEFIRLLGFPRGYELTGRPKELSDWARQWYAEHGRPSFAAFRAAATHHDGGVVEIGGRSFTSRRLAESMSVTGANEVVLVAVSAGRECEEMARNLWGEEKPDEYFFLEVYGSAVVEHLVFSAGQRLCAWADKVGAAILPHESPGYLGWDIREQDALLSVMRSTDAESFIPQDLHVLESGMLSPKKSLLAVFPIARTTERIERLTDLVPCTRCSLRGCTYRRLPYRHALPQSENMRGLAAAAFNDAPKGYRYATNLKALEKWSRERLRIAHTDGRFVDAVFRYDGTTCSNMGRPLAFEYRMRLEQVGDGYVIRERNCAPAEGDVGHTFMCRYIDGRDALMSTIAEEGPRLGSSLEEAMRMDVAFIPAGCYCEPSSRSHKWKIVLEVLHVALTSRI